MSEVPVLKDLLSYLSNIKIDQSLIKQGVSQASGLVDSMSKGIRSQGVTPASESSKGINSRVLVVALVVGFPIVAGVILSDNDRRKFALKRASEVRDRLYELTAQAKQSGVGKQISTHALTAYKHIASTGIAVKVYIKDQHPQLVNSAAALAASATSQIGHGLVWARSHSSKMAYKAVAFAQETIVGPTVQALSQQVNKTRPPVPACVEDDVAVVVKPMKQI